MDVDGWTMYSWKIEFPIQLVETTSYKACFAGIPRDITFRPPQVMGGRC